MPQNIRLVGCLLKVGTIWGWGVVIFCLSIVPMMMTIDDRDYDDQVKANLARPEEGCWGWQEQVNCTQVKLVVVLLVIIVGIISICYRHHIHGHLHPNEIFWPFLLQTHSRDHHHDQLYPNNWPIYLYGNCNQWWWPDQRGRPSRCWRWEGSTWRRRVASRGPFAVQIDSHFILFLINANDLMPTSTNMHLRFHRRSISTLCCGCCSCRSSC